MTDLSKYAPKVQEWYDNIHGEAQSAITEAKTQRERAEKAEADVLYFKAQNELLISQKADDTTLKHKLQRRCDELEVCLKLLTENHLQVMQKLEQGRYAKATPPAEPAPVKLNGGIEEEIRAAVAQTAKDQGRDGPKRVAR